MSPEAVLPPDVLQLAVLLCPAACQVHVRFDCSTPHDVLSPIATALHSLRELSVVCVTSGERSHLNFEDLTAILEHHGSDTLRSLELKVTYPELPTRAVGMFTPVRPHISTRDSEICRGLLPQQNSLIRNCQFPIIGNNNMEETQIVWCDISATAIML